MSTPGRNADLRNLTRSTRGANQSYDEGATHDQDSTLVAAVDGSAAPPCCEPAGHRDDPWWRVEAIKEIGPDSWTSRWTSFARRLGLDRQGMHAGIEFSPQEMIDRAMALDQALALKGFRNYFDVKVGSARARGRRPVHGMSVARVYVGFVDDFDGGGSKGGL